IAPVLIPLQRRIRMAEELNLHLLKLARAKREIPRRDFVAKTLPHLGNSKRHPHAAAVEDVFEVDEDALSRFRAEKRGVFLGAKRADDGLEHQVEIPRRSERSQSLRLRGEHLHVLSR